MKGRGVGERLWPAGTHTEFILYCWGQGRTLPSRKPVRYRRLAGAV